MDYYTFICASRGGDNSRHQSFIALVVKEQDEDGYSLIEVRNHFENNCKAEAFTSDGKTINLTMKNMIDLDGNKVDVARHPKQILKIKFKENLPINTFIRKR